MPSGGQPGSVSEGEPKRCDSSPYVLNARVQGTRQDDPVLARLVESWPELPEAVKAGIAAMIEASGKASG